MSEILLTQDKVTLVDEETFTEIGQLKWHAARDKSGRFYAKRTLPHVNGKQVTERMHRWILNAPKGMQVDHINGNTLDNRRENLRLATSRQNCQNRHNDRSSSYPGVNAVNRGKKWCSHITINGNLKHLGYFETEIGAFMAYLKANIELGFSIEQLLQKYKITMEELKNVQQDGFNWTVN